MGLVAETLTIKAHTIRTNTTKVTGTITLTTSRDFRTMFYKDLKFTKTEEAGDRFQDPDPVVAEAIINIWSQRMFAVTVMKHFTVRREAFNDGEVRQFKRSVVNCEDGQRFVHILNGEMLGVYLQGIQSEEFLLC